MCPVVCVQSATVMHCLHFVQLRCGFFFRIEFKNKISILNCQFMRLGLGLKIKRIMNKG